MHCMLGSACLVVYVPCTARGVVVVGVAAIKGLSGKPARPRHEEREFRQEVVVDLLLLLGSVNTGGGWVLGCAEALFGVVWEGFSSARLAGHDCVRAAIPARAVGVGADSAPFVWTVMCVAICTTALGKQPGSTACLRPATQQEPRGNYAPSMSPFPLYFHLCCLSQPLHCIRSASWECIWV